MKPIRILIYGANVWALLLAALPVASAQSVDRDAHRIVSLVDYIAGDYRLAVKDGRVVSRSEYDEQKSFVQNARALWTSLKDARADVIRARVDAALAAIGRAIDRVADAEEVARACKSVRDDIVSALRISLVPTAPPDLARARTVYAASCSSCHGPTGLGDGPAARGLNPPPASLHAPDRMESMTPYRAFNALKFGVAGTAMVAFETLSESDRWSLAFYVVSLRHAARGVTKHDVARLPLGRLALASDRDLRAGFASQGVAVDDLDGTLALARTRTTFEPSTQQRSIAHARRLVADAIRALAAGDRAAAERHALDAYLEGIEPIEAPLRARDSGAVAELERAATALRAAVARGDTTGARTHQEVLSAALARAETLLAKRGNASVAFIGSFLILFREGLEAALLIGALLGLLARIGQRRATRWVHYGWVAAVALGAATYFVAHGLLRIGAANRELMEGVLNLFAAGVLFYVSYWLLSKSDVARWMAFLKSKLEASAGRPGGLWAVAGLSFLAVYREALETVLFYQALLLDADGQGFAVAGGAAAGGLALIVAVLLIFRLGRRLPLNAFFIASGALLCLLAAVMSGKGVHALQEAGVVPLTPIGGPSVDWLGMYGDAIGFGVQGAIVALLVAASALALSKRKHARPSNAPPVSPAK